jgi:ADP-heptose:LPS heptosyltransferase
VIVLRVCALGDLVVTGPLLERLGEPFLVAHSEHVALARAAGWVREGIDADLAGLHALLADEADASRLAPALRERLARGEPVLAVTRPGPGRDALARGLRAAGAREVRPCDPLPPAGVHAADHLAAASGQPVRRAVPRIELPAESRARGAAIRRARGGDPRARPVAIHPGAGAPAKRWPADRWASSWRQLRHPGEALVICGPADEAPASELADRIAAPILRGLPLVDLAAALAGCRALLGHDSGVSHLSAALGIPTLAVFGPTDPRQWAPRGPSARSARAPRGDLARLDPACAVAAMRSLLQTSSR